MISSMTGFGRAIAEREGRKVTIEIKSVNHRFLDLSFRMPKVVAVAEDAMRECISKRLSRGHVDIYVSYLNTRNDTRALSVDDSLLNAYIEAANKLSETYGITNDISASSALRLPDVTTITEAEENRDEIISLAVEALDAALTQLIDTRKKEGARLESAFSGCIDQIEEIASRIAEREPLVVSEYSNRLSERINGLLGDCSVAVDESRLAMEVAIFADRASINEELVRTASHIEKLRNMLLLEKPIGREFDFYIQELNREFNTMGSKANDAQITGHVVSGKAVIEKMREQIQNIE
ncbi:MAG: YicC family protein [Eubacteriales bacterium]|nr:YicC family protein [Eubacteriales bacterium]MCI7570980.1 YicC family protein [Clostridiales bacterium]MDD7550100.1 YicC family protein [Clostridia bacterium]MDY5754792.1 YicC/YloC family endoribonuclease [Eubacteriales bacterium]